MKGILKVPLLVAAAFIVVRIITEQLGAPRLVNGSISVVALYLLVFPVYFAIRIARGGVPGPYLTHLKLTVLYAALCRLMIVPTYWLAYVLNWNQVPRFTLQGGGVIGGSPLYAFAFPFLLGLIWIVGAIIVGVPMGWLIILVARKKSA